MLRHKRLGRLRRRTSHIIPLLPVSINCMSERSSVILFKKALHHKKGSVPMFATNCQAHAHAFYGSTSINLGHRHNVRFFTYPVNGGPSDCHFHRFQGITYTRDQHFHRFNGYTGPPVYLPDGSHFHWVDDVVDDEPFEFRGQYYITVTGIPRHRHSFQGRTGPPLGYEPPSW
ncbi:YmaF family protein [Paenibacillus macerans]|uniref:YmaF family protein n=2 Tax=Paenibacillus macerans TaxID=44252 RepID=UPI0035317BA1